MTLANHPLLNDPSLTALILHQAAEGPVDVDGLLSALERTLQAAHEPPVTEPEIRPHLHALCADLSIAGLLNPRGGAFALTEAGRAALRDHPGGLDRADLTAWPPFAAHVHRLAAMGPAPDHGPREGNRPDAYLAGAAARVAGLGVTENPHEADSADHLAWESGWSEAEDKDG
jgi:DNA-binding PadR family transcriptional regulator